ncbi:ketopantoate reductase family protein [Hydrogenimonas sp.]
MKIAVVGAGGVGGYLAAMLARSKERVYLVARGANRRAVAERGICVETAAERFCARPEAVEEAPERFGTTVDAILFCTKGYDLEAAAESVRPIVAPHTLLVPFGNGVGNAETLRRLFPENPVANGAIYIVSHIREPGVVAVKGKGAYAVIGVDGPIPEPLRRLGDTLRAAGVKTGVSETITTEVWKKFLLIAAMATLTSCHDKPMGAIVAEHRPELEAILEEIAAVGRAEGAQLGEEEIAGVLRQVTKVPYDSPTSMWLDLKAGRPTELEQLGGYVVRKGREHGIATPVTERCYRELRAR